MYLDIQEEYIEQYKKRKQKEIFKQESQSLLGKQWELIDRYNVVKELSLRCEFPHENGKRCNTPIQRIFVIMSESGKLLKLGGSCVEKHVVDPKKVDRVEKEANKMRKMANDINRRYKHSGIRTYTDEERAELAMKADQLRWIPNDVKTLLSRGIPLPDSIYKEIEHSIEILRRDELILVRAKEDYENQKRLNAERTKKREKQNQLVQNERLFGDSKHLLKTSDSRVNKLTSDSRAVTYNDYYDPEKRIKNYLFKYFKKEAPPSIKSRGDAKKAFKVTMDALVDYAGYPNSKLRSRLFSEMLQAIASYYDMDEKDKEKLYKIGSKYVWEMAEANDKVSTRKMGERDFYVQYLKG